MPAQDVTLREMMVPPEPGDPFSGGEGIDHLVTVMEDSQVTLGGHHKLALYPVHDLPNISTGMEIAEGGVPEDGKKASPSALLRL